MNDELLKLARHSVVYGIGSALAAGGGLLLIPLYTNVLNTAQYGILELLNRIADILMLVMFMGVRQAYIRFYFDNKGDAWQRTVTGTTVVFALISSMTIAFLFYVFRPIVLDVFFKGSVADTLFLLVLIWIPLEMLVNIGLSYLQVTMKSVLYVAINFLRLFSFVALNILLLYVYRKGVLGVFIAQIIVTAAIALGFLIYFIKWMRVKVAIPLLKDLLAFGLPYLPVLAFSFIIRNSDRYFLSIYYSLDAVGIYALGYKIGMLGVMLLTDPFNKVWSPFLFQTYNRPNGSITIGRVFTLYTFVNVLGALLIAITAPIVIPLITNESFHSAARVVPVICLASVFYGMACLADAGILITKKTKYKPLIYAFTSMIAIIANIIFIPKFGVLGAAIAIALTRLVLFFVNISISNRCYHISLERKKIFLIFGAAFGAYSIYYGLGDVANVGYRTGLSFMVIGSFLIFLWLGGLFSPEEKSAIRRIFSRHTEEVQQ